MQVVLCRRIATLPRQLPRRRWSDRLRRLLTLAWIGAACIGGAVAATESPIRRIDVARQGDGFVLDAVMYAPVPPALAWDVLTDFDRMAEWVPKVRRSRVLARSGTTATVEQVGVARVGILGFPYVSVRAIDLTEPQLIRSSQLEGSMRRVESTMRLSPEGDGTRLAYHLEIVPGRLAARLLSKDFLEEEIDSQFTAIVAEMIRRRR